MNEKAFKATIISTKIMRKVEKDYPKLIGIEFCFENLNRVIVCPTSPISIIISDNDNNNYSISLSPLKNTNDLEEISDEVLIALEHLYDFLNS